jgi:hypothetical protein
LQHSAKFGYFWTGTSWVAFRQTLPRQDLQ